MNKPTPQPLCLNPDTPDSRICRICRYICNRENLKILLIGVLTILTACEEKSSKEAGAAIAEAPATAESGGNESLSPTIHIGRATSEVLSKFKSIHEHNDDNSGERIAIWANITLKNVEFISIGFDNSLFAESVLYSIKELPPEKAFVVKTSISEGIPTRGISFSGTDNTKKYFHISESGMDGSLSLNEFTPQKAANAPTTAVEQETQSGLIPVGYSFFEGMSGDLNGDGISDTVIIIKATSSDRRGIMIFFGSGNGYRLAMENRSCFDSEDKDYGGGNYMDGDIKYELSVKIKKGNLHIHYNHGGSGYDDYTFRYRNNDFELIGYDNEYRGKKTSINFLTKKKQLKIEVVGEEKEEWENIIPRETVRLSKITDFDESSNIVNLEQL